MAPTIAEPWATRCSHPVAAWSEGMAAHSSRATPTTPMTAPALRLPAERPLPLPRARCTRTPSPSPMPSPSVAVSARNTTATVSWSPAAAPPNVPMTPGTNVTPTISPAATPLHASTCAAKPHRHPPTPAATAAVSTATSKRFTGTTPRRRCSRRRHGRSTSRASLSIDIDQPSSLSAGGTPGGRFSCRPVRSVPPSASASS